MKKIFTLFAAAMLAVGANAEVWSTPEEAPEAGSTIVDDEMMTAKTVFGTKVAADAVTLGGVDFGYRMQVRVADWPNADNLTGTDNGGSTPIILEAKKDLYVTFAFRRQFRDPGYVAGDGKDIGVFSHPDATRMTGEMIETNDLDGSYGNCTEKFALNAGTYTVAAKGTTLGLFGFIYEINTGISDITVDAAGEAVYYNLNGVKIANPENGLFIKVQGGKATKVIK